MAEAAPESKSEPAPAPTSDEVAEAAPVRSERELWWEVLAVLAVGVLPPLWSAVGILAEPRGPYAYWLDSLILVLHSACASFVVLYLISRSGEPWSAFGLGPPRFIDLLGGTVLFLAAEFLWLVWWLFIPMEEAGARYPFPKPEGPVHYVLMVLKQTANGFTEELVTRAYLVTRLAQLLKSGFQAVVLSALLFTSYHIYYGPGAGLVDILLLGLLFGSVYLAVRRIWPLALAHMLIGIHAEMGS